MFQHLQAVQRAARFAAQRGDGREFACATFSIAAEVLSVYSIFQCG
jgi:hypothetical protein